MVQTRTNDAAHKAPQQRVPRKIRIEILAAGFQCNEIRSQHRARYKNQAIEPQVQRPKMNTKRVD